MRGRVLYVTGKLSPALAIAALLAHVWLHGASAAETVFLGAMLVLAVAMAALAMRAHARGVSSGVVHDRRRDRWR